MKYTSQHNAKTSLLTNWRGIVTSVRTRGLMVVILGAAMLGAGAMLLPSPRGHGTHTQLGLQSCGFLTRTGYPCFGCGMTTSLAAMTHGQIVLGFQAQPFGAVVCIAVFLAVLLGAAQTVSGKNIFRTFRPRVWWIWIIVAAWAIGWAYKVAAGLAAGQYPTI